MNRNFTHNDRLSVRVDNLVFAGTELGVSTSLRYRTGWIEIGSLEGHFWCRWVVGVKVFELPAA